MGVPSKQRDANPHRMTQHQKQEKNGTGHSVRVGVPSFYSKSIHVESRRAKAAAAAEVVMRLGALIGKTAPAAKTAARIGLCNHAMILRNWVQQKKMLQGSKAG